MDIKNNFEGLIELWLLDGRGSGRLLSYEEAKTYQLQANEWIWLHLDYTEPDVQQWMKTSSELSPLLVESLLQAETRPRSVFTDGALLVFLRGINHNPDSSPEDMVSLRLVVSEKQVITLRNRDLITLKDISTSISESHGPTTPGNFVLTVLDKVLDRANVVIEELYDQVDIIEDSVLAPAEELQHESLANVRRQAISIRRYLAPQRDAISRLSSSESSVFTDDDRLQVKEDMNRLTRMIEDLDAVRERASVIHELLVSNIAEQTNKRMYLLSIIAAIFLPLTFVTGLLGVNLGGIPGNDSYLAFPILVGLSVVIVLCLWLYFRSRKWF